MHDDDAYPLELSSDLTSVLTTAVAGLPPTATKKSINEKALLAVRWLDRAVFTSDPLVATLYRFFALEALLGDTSDGLKNGPLALRQMTLSRIATGRFQHPDRWFCPSRGVIWREGRPGPPPSGGYRDQRAWVGDRRAARMAGSSPARAPMRIAATSPPAQASTGMTVDQPLMCA